MNKQCIKCGNDLPLTDFYPHPKTGKPRSVCKTCYTTRIAYVRKCKVTINGCGLSHYWNELQSLYNEVGNNEFDYEIIKKYLTLTEHHRILKYNGYKQLNSPHALKFKKFKFTTSCKDWLINKRECNRTLSIDK